MTIRKFKNTNETSKVSAAGTQKTARTTMDTLLIERTTVNNWRLPPFQRPLRVNDKVREIAKKIKDNGGVIPGVVTIARIKDGNDAGDYLLDGQHRIEAFRLSDCTEALVDVRTVEFENMAAAGAEFVALNSQIVRMQPDDVLRGLENSVEALRVIRSRCPFVGYGQVRRGDRPISMVSMSAGIRVWEGSGGDIPNSLCSSAVHLAVDMSIESATQFSIFLNLCHEAWGMDEASKRLWGQLNLGLCAWLWRRMVLTDAKTVNSRYMVLQTDQFKRALMSLAANSDYCDWLVGRKLSERDRSPAYSRLTAIMAKRLLEDKVVAEAHRVRFPKGTWVTTSTAMRRKN